MNFEELLRKELVNLPIEYVQTECEQTYLDGKQDFAKALGEWAYNELEKIAKNITPELLGDWFNDALKDSFDLEIQDYGKAVYLSQIVVACLGKKEIKKRLSEL